MANPFQDISAEVFSTLQRDEQVGFGSYAIFGEQPSFYSNPDIWQGTGDSVLTEWLYPTVFEFTSSGLVNESTPIIPERISPTRSPIKNQDGQVMVSGDFAMHVHVEDMHLFWKYILMDDTPTCTDVTTDADQNVYVDANGNLTSTATGNTELKYYKTTFKNRDDTLHGLTAEVRKGTTSNTYMGLNIASATLNFAENIDVSLTVMGLRGYLRQGLSTASPTKTNPTVADSKGTVVFPADEGTTNIRGFKPGDIRNPDYKSGDQDANLGEFKRLTEDTYKGWGCAVRLYNDEDVKALFDTNGTDYHYNVNDDKFYDLPEFSGIPIANATILASLRAALTEAKNKKIVPVTDVTLTINHNLEHTPRYWGSRFPRRPIPTAKREITLDCTTDYTEDAITDGDFAQDFFENRPWDNAELLILHQPYYEPGVQQVYQTLVKLGRGQLTTYSDPSVDEQGPLTQTLNFKSLPRTAGASDELEVEVTSPENLTFIVKTRTELEKNPADRSAGTINGDGTDFLNATTA